jgi:KaiC/GvpD/RAD55 family RecA-like ATPase
MNILINDKKTEFTKADFPMLVSGAEKTGTSFFSICLLANLLKSGQKVLLFSAYPAAKEEFSKQIKGFEDDALIIESGEEEAFIEMLPDIDDLSKRVILFKNIDAYSAKLFEALHDLKNVIFSGDLDKCQFAEELMKKKMTTKIFFSQSAKFPQPGLESLEQYQGEIFSDKHQGKIILG